MKNSGFTLIELIMVLAILSIITIIAVPRYTQVYIKAKEDACIVNRKNIIKYYYHYSTIEKGLTLEDFLKNSYKYFDSDVNCPSGGEYSVQGNSIICSIH